MAWQLSPYLIPLLGSAVASLLIAGIGVYYRSNTGARSLSVLMFAVTWWSLISLIGLATTDLALKLFVYKIQYPAIGIIPVAWVVFAIQYTGRANVLTPRVLGALLFVPALTALLAWTNEYHGLIWSSVNLVSNGSLVVMTSTKGLGFWMHTAYTYVLVAVGTGLILRTALLSDGIYRHQAAALTIAVLLPWGGNLLFVTGSTSVVNPTVLGFVFSGLLLTWVIHRRQLLQVAPVARDIAREEIIDRMVTGVIIVDEDNQVVDLNNAAEGLVDHPPSDIIGQSLETVLPGAAKASDSSVGDSPESFEMRHTVDGTERIYDVQVTPLKRGYGTITGQLITFNDVTERKHREQRLKQQRQRLEVINRVLRHDIRNDMNVILGSAEVLPDTPEVEAHAQKIMRKSEEIVELSEKVRQIEVLNRQKSTHKEVIDIVEIVEQTVADLEQTYPSAEFHCDLPDQADAYTIGLISASINNVIENAVEHNDRSTPEIEVSVTEATDEAKHIAIAVSDNGPGLPDREREVIEAGTESPLNHSNGLGLWITSWIVTRSGGTITFSENSPRGSTITIRLPSVASKTDLS